MSLHWYYYLSWWFFIWFILYQFKLIPYSPYLVYIFVFTYIILKLGTEFVHYNFIDHKEIKNMDTLIGWLLIVFMIDVFPFLYMEREINMESTVFTVMILCIYILFMKRMDVDIIRLYTSISYRKLTDKYSLPLLMKCIFTGKK